MSTSYNYLLWLTTFVWLPSIFMLIRFPWLRGYTKTFVTCAIGALIFSVPWDFWAIYTGIWYFPPKNLMGVWIDKLPLEELLYITFVTLLISLITLVLKRYLYRNDL